jgi:A118 family predicted phage portal protein
MLPANNTPWMGGMLDIIYNKYAEWSSWYSGNLVALSNLYENRISSVSQEKRFKFYANNAKNEVRTSLHVPLAADIAQTSCNLLVSEKPNFNIPEAKEDNAPADSKATQERLEELFNLSDLYTKLLESAESASAMGGCFIKPNWDVDFKPFPVLSVAQVDSAIPVFKWGFLIEVTFWSELRKGEDKVVWRHLENHTKGKIYNGLYKGTKTDIGLRVSLQALPETADLMDEINTGIDDIAVRYLPNMLPNRLWRGSSLGQSDYSGNEGMLDSLNAAYTAWMREIKLGQARLIIPEAWLQRQNGEFKFDVDKELFTALDVDPLSSKGMGINQVQFELRVEQFRLTCTDFMEKIVTTAGYSPQSFGMNIQGQAESGTALNIKERKSIMTKGKKEHFFGTAINQILQQMLFIDKAVFKTPNINPEYLPRMEFQDSLSFDLNSTSDTIDKLNRAQAISTKIKVSMQHPDWSKEEIEKETKAILDEQGIAGMITDDLPV